jgi:hypothetical protein
VRSHVRNVRRKLKSATISQAVAVAIMLGLVTPKPPPEHLIVRGRHRVLTA